MNYQKYFLLSAVMMTLFWTGPQGVTPLWGQLAPPQGASFGGSFPGSEKVVPGIAWFGVLQDGMQQAKKTGKPILLVSAAPQCSGVPGMW